MSVCFLEQILIAVLKLSFSEEAQIELCFIPLPSIDMTLCFFYSRFPIERFEGY